MAWEGSGTCAYGIHRRHADHQPLDRRGRLPLCWDRNAVVIEWLRVHQLRHLSYTGESPHRLTGLRNYRLILPGRSGGLDAARFDVWRRSDGSGQSHTDADCWSSAWSTQSRAGPNTAKSRARLDGGLFPRAGWSDSRPTRGELAGIRALFSSTSLIVRLDYIHLSGWTIQRSDTNACHAMANALLDQWSRDW
jgi:hypothetical protein